jgi:hypothetical protein
MMQNINISKRVPLDDLDGGGTYLCRPIVNYILGMHGPIASGVLRSVDMLKGKIGPGNAPVHRALAGLKGPLLGLFQNQRAPYNKRYKRALEWCGGPGFIGFSLLENGICEELCVADINPDAIESVKHTVLENDLQDRVTYYVSDNFKAIPTEEKFDLIISNPPNYFNINPQHPAYHKYKDDLRPNDREWRIHWDFYQNVRDYLNPGAVLLISEVEPFSKEVFIPKSLSIPYDIRDRLPLDDFKEMITAGGLTYIAVERFFVTPRYGVNYWLVISRNDQP